MLGHIYLSGDEMDPNYGIALVIGFVVLLCVGIWAFGKFSVDPE